MLKLKGGYAFKSEKFQDSGVPVVRISNLPQNSYSVDLSDCVYYECGNYQNYTVKNGDLLIAMSGATTGKTAIYRYDYPAYLNQRVGLFAPKELVHNQFLYPIVESKTFISQLGSKLVAGAQPNISSQDIETIAVGLPSKEEQIKIAHLFELLNQKIETQSKIIEELTTLRSALYDSMFCSPEQEMPKFRIQSFSGKWQLRKLNEICSRKSIKNKDNLYSRVLTIAAQHGLVDQESFFKKRIASENLESYLCLEKGDFAYNKSYSSDYPWGAVKRLSNFDKGIISPLYICFTPKPEVVDPDYLAHYFESTKWHSGISEISGEGARNHGLLNMSVIDYFNTCHRIPGLDEQKAIARRLNAIAHKLQTEQEYLELLNRQKDCFLKQMFI